MTSLQHKQKTGGPDWKVRHYREGDEVQILALFKQVFGRDRGLDHWRWQFANNPYAPVQAVLAVTDNDDIIGQLTVQPVRLCHVGHPLLACQGLDHMVHPEFQGHGIIVKLGDHVHERLRDEGFHMLFGPPNAQNYLVLTKKMRWTRIVFLKQYSSRLTIFRKAKLLRPVFKPINRARV